MKIENQIIKWLYTGTFYASSRPFYYIIFVLPLLKTRSGQNQSLKRRGTPHEGVDFEVLTWSHMNTCTCHSSTHFQKTFLSSDPTISCRPIILQTISFSTNEDYFKLINCWGQLIFFSHHVKLGIVCLLKVNPPSVRFQYDFG